MPVAKRALGQAHSAGLRRLFQLVGGGTMLNWIQATGGEALRDAAIFAVLVLSRLEELRLTLEAADVAGTVEQHDVRSCVGGLD